MVLKQSESVTLKQAFSFVYKQVYLIFHYSCIQTLNEICLVGKIYCVCVCCLHSDDFSHVNFDYRLRCLCRKAFILALNKLSKVNLLLANIY